MTFEAEWLAARTSYDDLALDRAAIGTIRAWAAELARDRPALVVDLGSGTGTALRRAAHWLAPHDVLGYAVDRDATLLAHLTSDDEPASPVDRHPTGRHPVDRHPVDRHPTGRHPTGRHPAKPATDAASDPGPAMLSGCSTGRLQVVPVVGDLLAPLSPFGGPTDHSVDLVVGHALADLLPLDRLAARSASLVRPGGLVHLALTYDGVTRFEPCPEPSLDAAVLSAFHRHMDQAGDGIPSYGGARAGRRVRAALAAAGLEILHDAPSWWSVAAADGPSGRRVLARLVRYVADAAREVGSLPDGDADHWERLRQRALAEGTLAARVGHRDVLARRPDRPRTVPGSKAAGQNSTSVSGPATAPSSVCGGRP